MFSTSVLRSATFCLAQFLSLFKSSTEFALTPVHMTLGYDQLDFEYSTIEIES